jgi:hypothetical protein
MHIGMELNVFYVISKAHSLMDYTFEHIPPLTFMRIPMQIGLVVLMIAVRLRGFVFFLAPICCLGVPRNKTVSKSSTEAEYRSMAGACTELVWL